MGLSRRPAGSPAGTRGEEQELVAEYRRGMPLEAIAEMHGRSRRAIELRLAKLGLRESEAA